MNEVLIGTAGHIDHGKTTLVRTLTGINTDRLKEEQSRGITIDIGFAHCQLGDFRVGFIDVPGHERFVKNMLAGIGGIQVVALVIAADESVMPQTREHFDICKLLGLKRGLVVLTKKGAVEQDLLPLVEEEVADLVSGSFLEDAPIVAVDSVSGDGITELRAELTGLLTRMREEGLLESRSEHVFRMPVDRVFSIRGFGTVVTGTPSGGSVRRDSAITAYPAGVTGKVRGVEIFGETAPEARAGQRTALNLSGLERHELTRGMVLSSEPYLEPSYIFDVSVQLIEKTPPLQHRAPIRLHHGSAEAVGRLYLLGRDRLKPGSEGLGQVRLDQPLVAFPGERFILRRYSPMTTIGGGLILDNRPAKHRRRDLDSILPQLEQLAAAFKDGVPWPVLLESIARRRGTQGLTLRDLVSATGLQPAHLSDLVDSSGDLCRNSQDPSLVFHQSVVTASREGIVAFLTGFHDTHPLAAGAPQEEVKKRLLRHAPVALFQTLLRDLERDGLVKVRSGVVSLEGRRPELTDEEDELRMAILQQMAIQPLSPPTIAELERSMDQPADRVRSIFYFLLQGEELVKITDGYVVLPDQLGALADKIAAHFPGGQPFTVGEFKKIFDLSRKYAIPLLEHLDRQRVTRRQGDQRVVL